jgi:hypothetical protein
VTSKKGDLIPIEEDKVSEYIVRELVKREALRRISAHEAKDVTIPELQVLADLLQTEMSQTEYRINNWQPMNSRVILSAQNKSGKTTMRDNLVRSLVDGSPWLSTAAVVPTGVVTIIDNEMSEQQAKQWLKDQGIQNTDQVNFIALRGKVSRFNILDATMRSRWADTLRYTDYLIFDCLRPALDAFGLDEQKDTGRFLLPFDELMAEAGISESLIVHHMGHTSGRSRGDSRLRDWPDVEWFLERKDPTNPASDRTVRAYGRDVDVPTGKLTFNRENRHLSYIPAAVEKAEKKDTALAAVEEYLRSHGPTGQTAIEEMPKPEGVTRGHIRQALDTGLNRQMFDIADGPRRAKIWSLKAH